ncbi:MAG TPA: ROK family protein [Stellaceae bacterium]|nr:ROK family protein [Stellaceae bacterium]
MAAPPVLRTVVGDGSSSDAPEARGQSPRTLAIDVGGTDLKAAVLDPAGVMIAPRVHVPTPHPAAPETVLRAIASLVAPLAPYDRVSVGFPGVVRQGRIFTAPNLGSEPWQGFDLAEALATALGKAVRILNDADVQGLGVVSGQGFECVLTLGTGIGSALFFNGRLLPHLELGQHPIRRKRTYDQYLGDAALKKKGRAKWNRRLRKAIGILRTLLNYDTLYLGGGNALQIDFALPENVKLVSNEAGITGGVRLWESDLDEHFVESGRSSATGP